MNYCTNCPRNTGTFKAPTGATESWGAPESKLLIIGMAPGRKELLEGKPFVGGSGTILWSAAKRSGLQRADCYIMNAISCWPLGKDGTPTPEQLEACSDRFNDDLRGSGAEVLLTLGGDAFSRVTGLPKKITDQRGYMYSPSDCKPVKMKVTKVVEYKTSRKNPDGTFKYQKGDPRDVTETIHVPAVLPPKTRYIIPSLHPASIMREGLRTLPALKADLDRAVRASLAQAVPLEIIFGDSVPESPTKGPAVAVDLETSISTGQIERVGISDGTTTWTAEWTPKAREATRRELADEDRIKIAHNIQFDLPRLEVAGVVMHGAIFDTMLAAHLIQPDLYKALGRCAPLYLDLRAWKHLASDSPAFYNAHDAGITHALYIQQLEALSDTGMTSLFCDTIMPATRVLMDMTKRGIRVDMEWLRGWRRQLGDEQKVLLAQWSSSVGNVNPFSPPQLKKYLYGTLDLPVQKSKFGGVTTDEGAIKSLIEKSPSQSEMLSLLLRIREISKLKSTYSEVAIGTDGCVHPGYLPASKDTDRAGAATGRLASNIQQTPEVARRMFIPPEGCEFKKADYDSLELRIATWLSDEPSLKDAFSKGIKPHQMNADEWGLSYEVGKKVTYLIGYGGKARKLQSELKKDLGMKVSVKECEAMIDKLAKSRPNLWAWTKSCEQEAFDNDYVTDPFTRRMPLPNEFYKAANRICQGSGAGMAWRNFVPLEEAMKSIDGGISCHMHDDYLVYYPIGKAKQADEILHDVMEQEFPEIAPGFRCPINIKKGLNWRELT